LSLTWRQLATPAPSIEILAPLVQFGLEPQDGEMEIGSWLAAKVKHSTEDTVKFHSEPPPVN
jgi:hypothetical protein